MRTSTRRVTLPTQMASVTAWLLPARPYRESLCMNPRRDAHSTRTTAVE